MNNVDRIMELADNYAVCAVGDFALAKSSDGFKKSRAFLRTHLEAMEADRVRLLEALKWMVENDDTNEGDEPVEHLGGSTWNESNKYWIDGLNKARAAILQSTGETS